MHGDLNFNVVAFTIFSDIISTLREFLKGFFCMPRFHCLMHLFKFCLSCLSLHQKLPLGMVSHGMGGRCRSFLMVRVYNETLYLI